MCQRALHLSINTLIMAIDYNTSFSFELPDSKLLTLEVKLFTPESLPSTNLPDLDLILTFQLPILLLRLYVLTLDMTIIFIMMVTIQCACV